MEIKVTSTGTVSRLPERLIITMVIRSSGKTVSEAEELQDKRLQAVMSVLSESCVNMKFLSVPNVQELTKREEVQKEGSSVKEIRWVKDGYSIHQSSEILIDGWDSSLVYAFLSKLMPACEGNMSSKFELTENQKSEMFLEAMERSYEYALLHVKKMMNLEKERNSVIVKNIIVLKEAKIVANDYDSSEARNSKQSCFASDERISGEVFPVRKPLQVKNTVEYVFEAS